MIFEILDRLSGRKARRETMILQATMAFNPERWAMAWEQTRKTNKLIFDSMMASLEAVP